MIEYLIYILVGFSSVFITMSAKDILDTSLKQTFAGSGLAYGGFTLLENYTNMISFYEVSANGTLGFGGYIFIAGSAFLALVWIQNLYKYGQAVR